MIGERFQSSLVVCPGTSHLGHAARVILGGDFLVGLLMTQQPLINTGLDRILNFADVEFGR